MQPIDDLREAQKERGCAWRRRGGGTDVYVPLLTTFQPALTRRNGPVGRCTHILDVEYQPACMSSLDIAGVWRRGHGQPRHG